jgi:hypothetical protein
MATTVERQQLTRALLGSLQERNSPSPAELDRIERLISSREELELYIDTLSENVRGKVAPDSRLLDRLERLLRVIQLVDQETRTA